MAIWFCFPMLDLTFMVAVKHRTTPLAFFSWFWFITNEMYVKIVATTDKCSGKEHALHALAGGEGQVISVTSKYGATASVFTGFMCILMSGTPEQMLIAMLLMMTYMLVLLKTAPYVSDSDDTISFIVTVVLFTNMLSGYSLILDRDRKVPFPSSLLPTLAPFGSDTILAAEMIQLPTGL